MKQVINQIDSKFLYLQEFFTHLTINERKEYAEGLGQLWIDLINQDNVYLDKRDFNLYSLINVNGVKWFGDNFRYKENDVLFNPYNPNELYGGLYNYNQSVKYCPDDCRMILKSDIDNLNKYNNEDDFLNLNNLLAGNAARYDSDRNPGFYNLDEISCFWTSIKHANKSKHRILWCEKTSCGYQYCYFVGHKDKESYFSVRYILK